MLRQKAWYIHIVCNDDPLVGGEGRASCVPAHTTAILSSSRPTCPDGAVVSYVRCSRKSSSSLLFELLVVRTCSTSHVVRYATSGPATTLTSVRATAGRCTIGEKAISVPQLCSRPKTDACIISLLGSPSRVALSRPIRLPVLRPVQMNFLYFCFSLPSTVLLFTFNCQMDFNLTELKFRCFYINTDARKKRSLLFLLKYIFNECL